MDNSKFPLNEKYTICEEFGKYGTLSSQQTKSNIIRYITVQGTHQIERKLKCILT